MTRTRSWLLLLCAMSGCALSPNLASYPRRAVDRPLALPQGVARVTVGETRSEDWRASDAVLAASYGLTDRVELGVLRVTGELIRGSRARLAVTARVQVWRYTGNEPNWTANPELAVAHRLRLADDLALRLDAAGMIEPWWNSGARWRATGSIHVQWQARDWLVLGPYASGVARYRPLFTDEYGASVGMKAAALVHCRWEVSLAALVPLRSDVSWEEAARGEDDFYAALTVSHFW